MFERDFAAIIPGYSQIPSMAEVYEPFGTGMIWMFAAWHLEIKAANRY